ncbi:metal-binding protein [Thalassococcus sp. S3]|nr:DUF1636 domain-containing protein [Thalassococcus sp. S3]QBF30360.1 metal-binding protein [Thalassococcus sp. S3]
MRDETVPATELLICTKCRRGQEVGDDAVRPGAALHRELSETGLPEGIRLTEVECLSNCSQGCTIALRGPGRWTFVFGNLHETNHLDTIRDGAARYRDTPDGLVPWRERPEHFRKNCIARIPPMEAQNV